MAAKTVRPLPRLYDALLVEHFATRRQMAVVTGPRQVGKTTTCRSRADAYFDWDDQDHRRTLIAGPAAVASMAGVTELRSDRPLIALDELHKYRRWRTLLKGLFDTWGDRLQVVVTGSSRLDVYRRGGDSLMGRYLPYRMHPLSVAELLHPTVPEEPLRPPRRLAERDMAALLEHGGFPEPFVSRDRRFTNRWQRLRTGQMLRGDVRDLTRVQELGQIEHLGRLLAERSSRPIVLSSLAQEVQASVDSVRRWVDTLCALHWGFLVRPWFRNVAKALRKEPRFFLRDWSVCADPGARAETFVGCQLLKAVEGWEDLGFGTFELRYLRDKEKREVDFVVVRDGTPWFLVEVKVAERSLSPWLAHFQRQTRAAHAFQAVLEMPFVDVDCFTRDAPTTVPASTLLSQLL